MAKFYSNLSMHDKIVLKAKENASIDSRQDYYPNDYTDKFGNKFTSIDAYKSFVGLLDYLDLQINGKLTNNDITNITVIWSLDQDLKRMFPL